MDKDTFIQDLKTEISVKSRLKGVTSMRELERGLNWARGSLIQKCNNGSIRYYDILKIADLLGYEIDWKNK